VQYISFYFFIIFFKKRKFHENTDYDKKLKPFRLNILPVFETENRSRLSFASQMAFKAFV